MLGGGATSAAAAAASRTLAEDQADTLDEVPAPHKSCSAVARRQMHTVSTPNIGPLQTLDHDLRPQKISILNPTCTSAPIL